MRNKGVKIIAIALVFLIIMQTAAFAFYATDNPDGSVDITFTSDIGAWLNPFSSTIKNEINTAAGAVAIIQKDIPNNNYVVYVIYGAGLSIETRDGYPNQLEIYGKRVKYNQYITTGEVYNLSTKSTTSTWFITKDTEYQVLYKRGTVPLLDSTVINWTDPSAFTGWSEIVIPQDNTTITNLNTWIEIASSEPNMYIRLADQNSGEVYFEGNSQTSPGLIQRSGPNESGQYAYGMNMRDLPIRDNRWYILDAYGLNSIMQQSTGIETTRFNVETTYTAFLAIDGILEGRLYENNQKYSIERSVFIRNTPFEVVLNGQVLYYWAGNGSTKLLDQNLFSANGVDPRRIGINYMVVRYAETGDPITAVNFYLKTPFNPETGMNEPDFDQNTTPGAPLITDNGDIVGPDDSVVTKPILPADAGILDYVKHAFDTIVYVFEFLGIGIKNVVDGSGPLASGFGQLFRYLPDPLPALLVIMLGAAITLNIIKIVFGRK